MFNFRVNYKQVSSPLFYYIYMSHQTPIHNYPITYTEHEYGLHMQVYIMCIYIYIYNIHTLIIHAQIKHISPKSQPIPTVDPTVAAQICPGAVSAAPTTKGVAIGAGAGVAI